jgi:hypothetical protein
MEGVWFNAFINYPTSNADDVFCDFAVKGVDNDTVEHAIRGRNQEHGFGGLHKDSQWFYADGGLGMQDSSAKTPNRGTKRIFTFSIPEGLDCGDRQLAAMF